MISFINVGSGSKGNATLIYDEKTLIQIDMGLSLKRVFGAASAIEKTREDISAVLITHEHTDHVSSLIRYKGKVPIYASEGTVGYADRIFETEDSFEIGTLTIIPIRTSHDAKNPHGFVIFSGKSRLVYLTDSGYIPEETLPYIENADYYIIESNHDLKMLLKSHRPASLKRRIKGDLGHLSNVDSAIYISQSVGPNTKAIYLAHLSEECNTEEIALESYKKTFLRKEKDLAGIKLVCLKQHEMTKGGDE